MKDWTYAWVDLVERRRDELRYRTHGWRGMRLGLSYCAGTYRGRLAQAVREYREAGACWLAPRCWNANEAGERQRRADAAVVWDVDLRDLCREWERQHSLAEALAWLAHLDGEHGPLPEHYTTAQRVADACVPRLAEGRLYQQRVKRTVARLSRELELSGVRGWVADASQDCTVVGEAPPTSRVPARLRGSTSRSRVGSGEAVAKSPRGTTPQSQGVPVLGQSSRGGAAEVGARCPAGDAVAGGGGYGGR